MTLTTQMQLLEAWTMSSWLPTLVCEVTDWPESPASLTAGVAPGAPPAGTTNTWKTAPAVGGGVQRNAQPMFHLPLAIVNGVLVQLP